ncbi:beta-lactamase [Streptomyces hydrogenans]|uniref:Beta-lactamase n=1 Tax=Streptomyces hydrogenans TaxID=1873719 RepID=A0ABQ3PCD7_9ACTN|nr:class A beta-lactamase [Streptomyces hydrogenans]GHI22664.1 beta-lactamase [Streptomyces hydrogenans]
MYSQHPGASRRTALALGAGTALTAALGLAGAGPAHALTAPAGRAEDAAAARFRALEERYGARLGVHAHDVRTGRTLAHRDDERFPMCSTFKTLAVAAVLRDLDHDGTFLARRLHYTAAYVARSGWSPVTGSTENIARGMTVAELCDATIRFSDNTAANLLLRELGGPTAITRFARSTGDPVTRLDRWEPRLNSAEPWRITDTTTPRAIARTYGRLVLGRVLEPADRALLTDWLLRNTTSLARFRKGLPADWTVADKTGGGEYGTNNDVGVTWPPDGGPILLSVLTTRPEPEAEGVDELVAAAATVVAEELR